MKMSMPPRDARQPDAGGGARGWTRAALLRQGLAAGVTVSAAAACATPGTQAPAKPDATRFPAEMTWMPWSAGNAWLTPTYEEVAAAFAQKYPQSRLTILPAQGDFLVKLKSMITAGTPPDVADVHHGGRVRDLGPSGQVIDLNPFLKRDAYPKSYVGWPTPTPAGRGTTSRRPPGASPSRAPTTPAPPGAPPTRAGATTSG